jgi:AAA+ ATPase superfamily predicted ATPase
LAIVLDRREISFLLARSQQTYSTSIINEIKKDREIEKVYVDADGFLISVVTRNALKLQTTVADAITLLEKIKARQLALVEKICKKADEAKVGPTSMA